MYVKDSIIAFGPAIRQRYNFCCLLLCLLLLTAWQSYGREPGKRVQADAGIATGFSHTGYHTSLLFPVHYNKHTVYAGPKILLTESYLPFRNIWGIHAGYAYRVLQQRRWKADVAADYQCSFYKSYSFAGNSRYNRVQEIHLLLGLAYRFRPEGRLSMKLQLGSGLYADTWHDLAEGRNRTAIGRAATGRFTVSYKIF